MKILINYTEVRTYSYKKEVEMSAFEFENYCKMNDFEIEEKFNFCENNLANLETTEAYYQFIQL
jgi:hypothetical protein